jgi:MoaA/NifB/PqqE/SkfB family radical SAM enzyme
MWRSVRNYLTHLLSKSPRAWRPLVGIYHLSYACNFRCSYCGDGEGRRYYDMRSQELEAAEVVALLSAARSFTDHIVITGGEPLQHPGVDDVLRGMPALKFDSVSLTTNGYDLDQHVEAVASAVQTLVVSLDTLDSDKGDRWYGACRGSHARILRNLEIARTHRKRNYRILIASVATPDNLTDLLEVHRFAATHGFHHSVCPAMAGVVADPRLRDNPDYRMLYDHLIAAKRRGVAIEGSLAYLEHLRDLRPYRCRPSTVVAIAPDGEVYYPCLEIGRSAGNLRTQRLDDIRAQARARFGPDYPCPHACPSACALSFGLLYRSPWSLVTEGYWRSR